MLNLRESELISHIKVVHFAGIRHGSKPQSDPSFNYEADYCGANELCTHNSVHTCVDMFHNQLGAACRLEGQN